MGAKKTCCGKQPDKAGKDVLVRDKAGNFYIIPKAKLERFAVSEAKQLKAAAEAWKRDEPEVEGQWWDCPTPTAVAGVRG